MYNAVFATSKQIKEGMAMSVLRLFQEESRDGSLHML
jgi:hypothetical protein